MKTAFGSHPHTHRDSILWTDCLFPNHHVSDISSFHSCMSRDLLQPKHTTCPPRLPANGRAPPGDHKNRHHDHRHDHSASWTGQPTCTFAPRPDFSSSAVSVSGSSRTAEAKGQVRPLKIKPLFGFYLGFIWGFFFFFL